MTSSLRRLILILTLFMVAVSVGECAASTRRRTGGEDSMDDESGERTILRRAYQQLLRLKSLPELRHSGSGKKQRSPPASPPRYMLELYEKYRRGDASVAAKRGNTVRSILSVKGDVNGEQMLLFNLSGISLLAEEILHAELHFYGRRKVKWPERSVISPKYCMKFFSISSEKVQLSPLSSINFTANVLNDGRHGGWRVFDVTRQVTDCRQQSVGLGNHLLATSFQGVNKKLKFVGVPFKTLMKMHNTPFLIVFSNDKDNASQSEDSVEPEENLWKEQNEVPKFVKDDFQFEEQDTKLKSDSAYLDEENSASLKRFSRSILESNKIDDFDFGGKQHFGSGTLMSWVENNEYPDNSVLPGKEYFPKTNPGVLVPRKRNRTEQANGTIPLPTEMSPFGQKKRLKKKKNATLPSVWQDRSLRGDEKEKGKGKKIMTGLGTADVKVVQSAKGTDESWCQRKRLLVNFDELNWGDWIISPQSFEAYFCSGQCHFPLVKKRNPSNHAIIQSIVNALGIRKEVPAPCCVADAVTSLTLLFFDENHNVVLKNYPGMIVESCACR